MSGALDVEELDIAFPPGHGGRAGCSGGNREGNLSEACQVYMMAIYFSRG